MPEADATAADRNSSNTGVSARGIRQAAIGGITALLLIAAIGRHLGPLSSWLAPFRFVSLHTQPPPDVLLMPVSGVRVERVSDTWHAPRSGDRLHEGQDIFARTGTRVVSAADGIVTRIGQNRLGGNVVSVAGRGGRSFYYAHLSAFAPGLEVGDRVHAGSLLGFVGQTGNARSTPPHLHFGMYSMTGASNPLPLLVNPLVPRTARGSLRAKHSISNRKARRNSS